MPVSFDYEKIKGGDSSEFRRFFDNFYPKLLSLACRFVEEETAEDIVQDTFLFYWEMKDCLEINQIHSFLFKIVQNKCLNYLKHCETVRAYEAQIHIAQLRADYINEKTDANEIFQQIELHEIQAKLEEAIRKLPEKCGQAFLLRFFEEKSYKEIAEMMGISHRTVEGHINRAINQLRPLLRHLLAILI